MEATSRYCHECGRETSANAIICPSCGVQLSSLVVQSKSVRNRFVAALLAFFLGNFGIQWFYLGRTIYGIFSILFCWTFIPSIISFIHAIILLISSDASFDAKYNN